MYTAIAPVAKTLKIVVEKRDTTPHVFPTQLCLFILPTAPAIAGNTPAIQALTEMQQKEQMFSKRNFSNVVNQIFSNLPSDPQLTNS